MAERLNKQLDQCLYNTGKKIGAGSLIGFALSLAFKRRITCTMYGAGMGAGYGFIQCNRKFEEIEKDRTKVKQVYVVRHGQRADFLPPEVRPPIELYFDP